MLKDILGSIFSIVTAILILFVGPMYDISIIQWARAESEAMAYTRNLIDEVIDTRQFTKDTYEDYSLNLASTSGYFDFTVTRKVKCVMPDPVNVGQTYTTYIVVDDISTYNQGDIFIVKVSAVGHNMFQTLSSSLLGLNLDSEGFTLAGRVR